MIAQVVHKAEVETGEGNEPSQDPKAIIKGDKTVNVQQGNSRTTSES